MSRIRALPVLVGLLAFIYSAIGVTVPSLWTDEAATASAVGRSFPELVAMLGKVDAVHGLYYTLMFGWTRIFGLSELSLRLPSLLAVAVAAGLMMALCRRLGGTAYGVAAAALFVILPRVQYVATDARSYAMTVLGAVLATYLLAAIRESPSRKRWIWYGLAGIITVGMSFYAVLMLAAHATTALLDERLRRQWRPMALASIAWLAPAALIAAVASRQQLQIAWVPPIGASTPYEVVFLQFFGDAYYSAGDFVSSPPPTPGEDFSMYALALLLGSAAVVGAVLARKHFVVRLSLPWLLLPLTVVIGGSALTGGGYYLPRYLSFELAALPMLAAAPLLLAPSGKPRFRWLVLAGLLPAALLVAVPSYLGQRSEYGRAPSDDFRFIAETLHRQARPGDAFVIGNDRDLAIHAYPGGFEGLKDATLVLPAAQWGRIFDLRLSVPAAKDRIQRYGTVWLIERNQVAISSKAMQRLGYAARQRFSGISSSVIEFERPPR